LDFEYRAGRIGGNGGKITQPLKQEKSSTPRGWNMVFQNNGVLIWLAFVPQWGQELKILFPVPM
jgi:hypothetical protein